MPDFASSGAPLASAYVEIGVDLRRYYAGLGKVKTSLGGLGKAKGLDPGLTASARSSRAAFVGVAHAFGAAMKAAAAGIASAMRRAASASARAFAAVASSVGKVASGIRGMLPGGGIMGLIAGAGVGLAVRKVVDDAIDLEARLAQVRKTTGLSGDALVRLKNELQGLASTMPGVKFDELLDIAAMGGRLGIAGDKIGRFARDIGMIRVALDDIPAEEAATSIARILNVFGRGSEDAIRFASALNKLDDTSTATGRDILDITQRLSGSAKAIGLTTQKTLALAAALKDAGVENEVAGTAIGQLLGKMATDTKAFAKIAGVSTNAFTATLRRDPLEAIKALSRGLSRLDEIDQFRALDQLGLDGQRTSRTLLQLGSVIGKLDGYVKTSVSEWGSLRSIMAENAVQADTTRAQLDKMWNIIQITSAKIGGYLLPILKALANSFGELATDIQGLFGRNAGAIEGVAGRIAGAAKHLGLVFREWKTVAAIAIVTVQEKFEQLSAIMGRLGARIWDQLKFGASTAFSFLKNLFKALGGFLGDLFAQIGLNLAAHINNAVASIGKQNAGLIGLLNPVLGAALAVAGGPKAPQPIVPNQGDFFAKDKLLAGIGKRPAFNFGGIFKGLPNQAGPLGVLKDQLKAARAAADLNKLKLGAAARPDIQLGLDKLPGMARGLVRPQTDLERLNAQNRAKGLDAFKGTEAQARRILATRADRRADGDEKAAAKAAQPDKAAKPMGLAARLLGAAGANLAKAFGAGDMGQKLAGAVGAGMAGGAPALAKALAGPGKGLGEKGGAAAADESRGEAQFTGLAEFSRQLQLGAFGGKDDVQKKLLTAAQEQNQLWKGGVKITKDSRVMPAVAGDQV